MIQPPTAAELLGDREPPTELQLCNDLDAWCGVHNLPFLSADELLHEELTPYQRQWVSNFIILWDDCMEREAA